MFLSVLAVWIPEIPGDPMRSSDTLVDFFLNLDIPIGGELLVLMILLLLRSLSKYVAPKLFKEVYCIPFPTDSFLLFY